MTDYAKREMKALDRITKKISDAEGPKDSTENHYVYEEEETVINDLKKDFAELDDKLAKLNDFNGGDIDAFRTEHHYLEKAQYILKKAGKLN